MLQRGGNTDEGGAELGVRKGHFSFVCAPSASRGRADEKAFHLLFNALHRAGADAALARDLAYAFAATQLHLDALWLLLFVGCPSANLGKIHLSCSRVSPHCRTVRRKPFIYRVTYNYRVDAVKIPSLIWTFNAAFAPAVCVEIGGPRK